MIYPHRRNAFTTMELVVSVSASAVLTLGLASAVFVAGSSLEVASRDVPFVPTAGDPYATLRRDLQEATSIEHRDGTLQIHVPDRDGDGNEEALVYSIANDDLVLSENGTEPYVFVEDIINVSLESIRIASGANPDTDEDLERNGRDVVLESARHFRAANADSVDVGIPAGTEPGDLLLIVVAQAEPDQAPLGMEGWNQSITQDGSEHRVTVFYRFHESGDSEVETVRLNETSDALVTVLRISADDATPKWGVADSDSGIHERSSGNSGPPPVAVSPTSLPALEIQVIATTGYAMHDYYSGLTGFADIHFERIEDLSMACALRRLTVDSGSEAVSTFYAFDLDDVPYVAIGFVVESSD